MQVFKLSVYPTGAPDNGFKRIPDTYFTVAHDALSTLHVTYGKIANVLAGGNIDGGEYWDILAKKDHTTVAHATITPIDVHEAFTHL